MKESLRAQLDRMQNRLEELNAQLASEDIGKDISLLKKLNQEHAETSEVLDTYALWKQAGADLEAARQMREEPDMREFADEEIADAETRLQAAQERIEYLLLPRDPDDARNAILEIRAGTGGDESALFAGDLLRMYLRYAEHRGWQTEILSASESELGGYREVIVQVSGQQVYGRLRYESGAHRVQRVPVTESQGRIHTSAVGVFVMPEIEDDDEIVIDPGDLRIDVYRSSGPGGQSVNTTDSAVRITHIPSGIVVSMQNEKSQLQNKEAALRVLASRLAAEARAKREAEASAQRLSQVRTVDRSERIRTYNFPENRIADHRTGFKAHNLDAVLSGALDAVIASLQEADEAERLAAAANA